MSLHPAAAGPIIHGAMGPKKHSDASFSYFRNIVFGEGEFTMSHDDETSFDMAYMFNIVKQRFGDRLTAEELEEVQEAVEGIGKMTASLRAVKLNNGDEPFTRFVPYRKDI